MTAARRISILAALVVGVGAAIVPAAGAGSSASSPLVLPTIYVEYTNNCTFSVVGDDGKPISQLIPGRYQVDVQTPIMFKLLVPGGPSGNPQAPNDFTGCKGWVQFQLSGPGVSLFTTLDSGCDSNDVVGTWTFQPNSTYVFEDLNQPSATRMSIATAAGGTPPVPTKSPYSKTSGKGTLSTDLIASSAPIKGRLVGKLAANGDLTLTTPKGKPVSRLSPGRYTFLITDNSKRAGVSLAINLKTVLPTTLSTAKFVGTKKTTVPLSAGRWTVSAPGGQAYTISVR